ncbi:MAG TPA: hypothetical protein VFD43_12120, partial [Planctomycetota bacterium]|nr:hypothetical protein [Planctomycetota bacterium]
MTTGLKLYLSSTASAWDLDSNPADLQGTFQLNEVQDGSSHEFTVTLDATLTTCAWYFATKGNVPSNAAWETGDWSIPINITDALARSEVTVGLKLVDIDSGGLGGPGVIETSLYAANQGANTTGVKTFTFSSEAWANSNDATDRLIIEVRFYKGLTDGVVGFTVGDANVVLTPLTRPHTVAPTAIIISGFVPSPSNSTVATVAPSAASCSGVAPAPGGSTAAVCLAAAALASALVPVPAVATAATVAPTPAIAS